MRVPNRRPTLFACHSYTGDGPNPSHVALYRDRRLATMAAHVPIEREPDAPDAPTAPRPTDTTVTVNDTTYTLVWLD